MVQRLPPEPPSDVADVTTKIRFRLPGGNTATRRFLAAQSLQVPAVSFFLYGVKQTMSIDACVGWNRFYSTIFWWKAIRPKNSKCCPAGREKM